MKQLVITILLFAVVFSLYAQGIVFPWGNNGKGQLNAPVGGTYKMVTCGAEFVIALRTDGSLVGWGDNARGQINVPPGNNFIAVSAGFDHSVALRSNGTLVAWGYNDQGQTNVPSGSNFVKIDAGTYHCLALKSDGSIVGWGRNSEGQLNVPSGTYKEIAAGEVFSAAIRIDGSLVAWGAGWNGETNVPNGNDYVKISAQYHHGLALRSNGTLSGWGVNWNGQLNIPMGITFSDMSAGWFHSIGIKSDGSLIGWGADWSGQASIPSGTTGLAFTSVSTGMHFSTALTVPVIADADHDGIANNMDDYPEDANRAFNNYFPGPDQWGTLAFEDMWPSKGDYDFNDLVIDYRINQVTNADNKYKDLIVDLRLRAVGATNQNAFAVELPFSTSAIENLVCIGNGEPYNMPLEPVGNHVILKVISNTNDFVSVPGHDVFWNTQNNQQHYDAIPLSFAITFAQPFDPANAAGWGMFNPFLIVNRESGHEIHLPGYPPTIKADISLFGQGDDTSNPTTGRYYKTANNLPWALDIPISWKYPIEKKQITNAYLAFAPWAESNGTQCLNWYELTAAQINSNNIYNH